MDLRGSKTERNLLKTFAGESRANTKYTIYSEIAIQEELLWIAEIFKETAHNELAHAREVYRRYLELAKDTKSNLLDAIGGETEETKSLYKEFEKDAREEGFDRVADFYKELREVEASHQKRYTELYNQLNSDNFFEADGDKLWKCMNCGYIHEGNEAPRVCPLCKYPQGYFKLYCDPLSENEYKD
ncbi:rubrerythrin family protein [Clostridium sp. 'White wine YQ']|uniref:rubrerythrin family protein n=1 Tax=Clostridium sp. 'White wine YQ' TaxID=3027474 RepID=UPI002365018F|nr:rubrerythrin family protein [Clostridium sp. 'White wine YQ']MDD7792796.1 rubrerythrin family protein [Clostridium sp. 'White wine YQ']